MAPRQRQVPSAAKFETLPLKWSGCEGSEGGPWLKATIVSTHAGRLAVDTGKHSGQVRFQSADRPLATRINRMHGQSHARMAIHMHGPSSNAFMATQMHGRRILQRCRQMLIAAAPPARAGLTVCAVVRMYGR